MKLFKKKEEKKKEELEKNKGLAQAASNQVFINIFTTIEDTPVYEDGFMANIITDESEDVRYIVNVDKNFKELYPEKDTLFDFEVAGDTKKEKINNLKLKIAEKKKKLKEVAIKPLKEINEEDLEKEVKILEIKISEIQRGGTGSPMYVAKQGLRNFFYEKTSGEYIPWRWHARGKSMYRDIAYKKKFFAMANSNLMAKYGQKLRKAVDSSLIWLLFIAGLWTIALMIGSFVLVGKYHDFDTMYDDSRMIELKTKAETAMIFCVENVAKASKELQVGATEQKENLAKQEQLFNQIFGDEINNAQPQTLPDR